MGGQFSNNSCDIALGDRRGIMPRLDVDFQHVINLVFYFTWERNQLVDHVALSRRGKPVPEFYDVFSCLRYKQQEFFSDLCKSF